jgi:hypothetical protein
VRAMYRSKHGKSQAISKTSSGPRAVESACTAMTSPYLPTTRLRSPWSAPLNLRRLFPRLSSNANVAGVGLDKTG